MIARAGLEIDASAAGPAGPVLMSRLDELGNLGLRMVRTEVDAQIATPVSATICNKIEPGKPVVPCARFPTAINTAMIVYLPQQASGMHFSGDIVNVPGTSVMGAQKHAEYQVNPDALLEMVLDIFYEPVDG